ncbi:sensor histidine kinase [Dyella terrae]|uniref:sensor histidine kinase n=1 Tax=Dyella terrae TaxID=522259 RepID=UPI001EFE118F|nr:histidine kinase [Dyella terrae]ULU23181.1 histidine kinase [Dyella terrae]
MTRLSSPRLGNGLPLRVSLLASLPIALCMAVMALPELGRAYAGVYRAFYAACFLCWVVPLSLLQRDLWRRDVSVRVSVPLLLLATYVPSVINNTAAQAAAVHWQLVSHFEVRRIFAGLDGCWLALIAFCAAHALLQHYDALQLARRREAEAVALAREAELRALQYQLHPHFLFNTLNSISSLVVGGRGEEATHMIARLGDLLRATLERSDQREVTLAEELSLTEHYLDIEKARLGSRLHVTLRVGAGLLQALLPPLLLQPLVENAIRHGITLRPEGGELRLHMERDEGALVIELHNDGMSKVMTARAEPSTTIGLANVKQRLQTLYPGRHQVTFAMDDDGACTVRLAIPLRLATRNVPSEASDT